MCHDAIGMWQLHPGGWGIMRDNHRADDGAEVVQRVCGACASRKGQGETRGARKRDGRGRPLHRDEDPPEE